MLRDILIPAASFALTLRI